MAFAGSIRSLADTEDTVGKADKAGTVDKADTEVLNSLAQFHKQELREVKKDNPSPFADAEPRCKARLAGRVSDHAFRDYGRRS